MRGRVLKEDASELLLLLDQKRHDFECADLVGQLVGLLEVFLYGEDELVRMVEALDLVQNEVCFLRDILLAVCQILQQLWW